MNIGIGQILATEKMQLKHKFLVLVMLCLSSVGFSQTDLTLYNMNWIPQSMYQNPALTPPTRVNIGLPVISSLYFQAANTGFAWKDLMVLGDDDSITLDVDNMLSKLGKRNLLMANVNTDLLSFGFKTGQAYIGFNATTKGFVRFLYPEDFFTIAWKGNGGFLGETADFSGLGLDASLYTEYGLSYTRDIFDDGRLKIGGKLKYLNGITNIYTSRSDINLFTDADFFWLTANSDFQVNAAGPIGNAADGDSTNDAGDDIAPTSYFFGKNHGFGADLGFSWEVVPEKVRVSGSIIDLGFIRWKDTPVNIYSDQATFTFQGIDITDFPEGDSLNGNYFDSLGTAILDSLAGTFAPDTSYEAYTAPTIPRFYIGANYLINEKMNAGILFSGEVYKGMFRPTLTASYNLALGRVLQLSVSWSYANRSIMNPGLGISLNAGPVQIYAVTDNILGLATFKSVPTSDTTSSLQVNSLGLQTARQSQIHVGLNLTFGREQKDRDKDGIIDKDDQCPDDPGLVEFQGCPDRDGDKIIDSKDACPDVPGLAAFSGCPDSDGDGIVDSADVCIDVPGLAEFQGCPDRDGDKIQDSKDACPDQPGPVETNGCPDRDRDGILDSEDVCPDKPGDVEHKGCPDTDGDGTYDNEDKCVDDFGPKDNFGCPYGDLDKDGVFDKEDRCVDTPGPKENQGCPYGDLDGDGVTDNVDDCPNTPGPADNKGCPKLTVEEQKVLDLAFSNLEFESGKAIIRATSLDELDSLAALLISRPDWKLNIAGHTDDVGNDANNMTLSKNRANAVKNYLNSRGVAAERFIVEWYGETKPLVPNINTVNRQKNRRVEMKVKFE
jgi:outer membrane protein OmpA-like peptidoglycan-associated protein